LLTPPPFPPFFPLLSFFREVISMTEYPANSLAFPLFFPFFPGSTRRGNEGSTFLSPPLLYCSKGFPRRSIDHPISHFLFPPFFFIVAKGWTGNPSGRVRCFNYIRRASFFFSSPPFFWFCPAEWSGSRSDWDNLNCSAPPFFPPPP